MGTQIFLGNPPANVEQWIKDHYGPKLDEPLCFTAKEANSTVAMNATRSAPEVSLEYSTDGNTWSSFMVGITTVTLANIEDKVYIRANNDNTKLASDTSRTFNYFVITGTVSVSGNIMTLLKADGSLVDLVYPENRYAFAGLFDSCTAIVDASSLLLPSSTSNGCYANMFYGCSSLTKAPELPATALANKCYFAMFYNCTSLTTAPELPATTLADYCYDSMFYNCTSLTTAPELPATTLANGCYSRMFYGCSSLTSAPELPATTLADYCYKSMFYSCSKLSSLNVSFTAWVGANSTATWLKYVAASGTFTCPT